MKIKIPKNKYSQTQKLTIRSCEYVDATELFKGCSRAFASFAYLILHKKVKFDCSWGNNQKTLIHPDLIADVLSSIDRSKREEDDEIQFLDLEVITVFEKIDRLPKGVYINLED